MHQTTKSSCNMSLLTLTHTTNNALHRLYTVSKHLHRTIHTTPLKHNNTANKPDWYNDVQKWTESIYKHSSNNPVTRTSQLESDIQHRFYATFNQTNKQLQYYKTIDEYNQHKINIHPASHLAYFVHHTATNVLPVSAFNSLLADDGYESDYQPPVPFTLRMFAGGHIQYSNLHHSIQYSTPYIGDICTRKSQLLEQPFIKHGKSGWLVFVSVEHKWYADTSDKLVLNEIQRYVYRTPPEHTTTQQSTTTTSNNTATNSSITQKSKPDYLVVRNDIKCDEVLLFRYSALTWNAHQIHYDYNWAQSEGYSGVLVHGPLQATLCIDTIHTYIKHENIGTLKSFEYRAQRPLVANTDISITVHKSRQISDSTVEYTVQIIPRDSNEPAYFTATAVVQLNK